MGHIVQIRDRDHFIQALKVLDKLPGMWHARGNPTAPTLLVTETHFTALVSAGVVSANGKEGKTRDKKAPIKKARS